MYSEGLVRSGVCSAELYRSCSCLCSGVEMIIRRYARRRSPGGTAKTTPPSYSHLGLYTATSHSAWRVTLPATDTISSWFLLFSSSYRYPRAYPNAWFECDGKVVGLVYNRLTAKPCSQAPINQCTHATQLHDRSNFAQVFHRFLSVD